MWLEFQKRDVEEFTGGEKKPDVRTHHCGHYM